MPKQVRCSEPLYPQPPESCSTLLSQRFEQALVIAAQLHRTQRRKVNGVPYISHLLSVVALVLEDGGTEDEAIAALFHDAVEDQGGLAIRSMILEQFGEQVVGIVDGCTEPERWPEESWRQHKRRYLRQVEQGTSSIHCVALADKLHNGRSLLVNRHEHGPGMWQHFQGKSDDILWFYKEAVRLFESVKPGWMVNELVDTVKRLNRP